MQQEKRQVTAADLLNPEFHRRCEEESMRKVHGPLFGSFHKPIKKEEAENEDDL